MSADGISMMAGNFVSSGIQESKYSKARQAAAEARGQMANRQDSLLFAGMAACTAADPDGRNMSRRILEGKKAARRMQLDMQQNVTEKSRDYLDELKKRREEKTEETLKRSEGQKPSVDERGAAVDAAADAAAGSAVERAGSATPQSSVQAPAQALNADGVSGAPAAVAAQVSPERVNLTV